ncbi:hypothetical protein LCGC14_2363450 [marine sediment metagenome]|uniref:Uncharacterized protein n=1 Tax=marine sediment metagenome TaxID=412755 RepID=A0A0F9CTB3_9ZZZZ
MRAAIEMRNATEQFSISTQFIDFQHTFSMLDELVTRFEDAVERLIESQVVD